MISASRREMKCALLRRSPAQVQADGMSIAAHHVTLFFDIISKAQRQIWDLRIKHDQSAGGKTVYHLMRVLAVHKKC